MSEISGHCEEDSIIINRLNAQILILQRRLARYDEAVSLLRDYETVFGCVSDAALAGKVRAFLAAEPKEGR